MSDRHRMPSRAADAAGAPDASLEDASLDPRDWESYRALAHRMLDEMLDYVRAVPDGPAWRPVPDAVKAALADDEPPRAGEGAARTWDAVRHLVLPYPTGNLHPRFFGWVHGGGTVGGALAEMVAAAMNSNLGGREHAPVYVERQVLGWCKRIFGFPPSAGGLLVTGTSIANVIALATAREAHGTDVRARGVALAAPSLVAYTSVEAHVSVQKALELLGLGGDAARGVPVTAEFRMDIEALRRMIAEDRARGRRPFCVVGTAGTVNTGAVDDLTAIAEVCAAEELWFHVDGAFGAMAALSPALRPLVAGIERADSLAFDFHKWTQVPYAAACVLVRDGELQRRAFAAGQSYLEAQARGAAGGAPWFCDFGPDLSRGFAALKVWFTIREHGVDALAAVVEQSCRHAAHLAELVSRAERLTLAAPVSLDVVCFRYDRPDVGAAALDEVNQEIIYRLHESGAAVPSSTRVGGRLVIRAAVMNHRTRREDVERLARDVAELGDRIVDA